MSKNKMSKQLCRSFFELGNVDHLFDSKIDSKPVAKVDSNTVSNSDVEIEILRQNYNAKQKEKHSLINRLSIKNREFNELYTAQTTFVPTRNEIEYIENSLAAVEKEQQEISNKINDLGETLFPEDRNILSQYV
jgi:predicted  nucleic acid-binding Zn-ribbon protein